MPTYLILGDTNVNCNVFSISNSICSLLIHWKVIDFYILTLYPATCCNCLLVAGVFLLITLGFLHRSCHLGIKTILFLPSQSLSSSTALARSSSNMLKSNSGRGQPCLDPNLNGKTFEFLLSVTVAASFFYSCSLSSCVRAPLFLLCWEFWSQC